jgi:hypothetical protein
LAHSDDAAAYVEEGLDVLQFPAAVAVDQMPAVVVAETDGGKLDRLGQSFAGLALPMPQPERAGWSVSP